MTPRWLPWAAAGVGVAAVVYIVARPRGYSYGGAPLRAGVDRDPAHLLPEFADKLERVFRRMRARGFHPLLWEGYRTPERAAQEAREGDGVVKSLHTYGVAADVVDESTAPRYWDGTPGFWTALGEETEREGLTWGGRFTRKDADHVQLVPPREQYAFFQSHQQLAYG